MPVQNQTTLEVAQHLKNTSPPDVDSLPDRDHHRSRVVGSALVSGVASPRPAMLLNNEKTNERADGLGYSRR